MQTTQIIKKAKSRRKKGRPRKYRPGEVIGFYTKLQSDAYYLLKQRARERNTSMLKLLNQLIFENLDGRYAKKTREDRFIQNVLELVYESSNRKDLPDPFNVRVSVDALLDVLSLVGCTRNLTTLGRYMATMRRRGLARRLSKNVYVIKNKLLKDRIDRIIHS